jgi:ribosomal protein S1
VSCVESGEILMDSWEAIRYIYKIGSPIKGTVIDYIDDAFVLLETNSPYKSVVPFHNLVDYESTYTYPVGDNNTATLIVLPTIGSEINTVISNFGEDVLYLSAKPSDISESTIKEWQLYYEFIDTIKIGSIVAGTVSSCQPFGLFVDIGAPYIGLIDVGHTRFNGGDSLPDEIDCGFEEGEEITCRVSYFRLHNKQIGLGWIKPDDKEK